MSKERLEEIKESFNNFVGILAVFGEIDDYREILNDFRYTIKRAERAEELEEQLNNNVNLSFLLERQLNGVLEQNKRYREAIERAIDKLTWNSVESEEILLEALEGEE